MQTKSSNDFFKTLLDTTSDAFFLHDKEGTLLNVNQQACDALGYTREELLALKVSNIEIGPDPETLNKIWEELAREKKVRIEGRHCRKDGATFPVEVSIGLINVDNKDLFSVLARDITERKNFEYELTSANHLLQAVLDTIPARVFWKDTDNKYIGCNQAFAEDADKKSPEELTGKNDFDFPWKEQAPLYRKDDTDIMQSGKSRLKFEEPQSTPEGDLIWLETSKIPLRKPDGEVYGVLGTYQDITEQKNFQSELIKAKEEAENANEVKSKFLTHMSHEFLTPMNAILGFGQILNMKLKDEDNKSYVKEMLEGGNHLLELVNNMLDLSEIETGKLKYTLEDYDLNKMINESVSFIEPLATKHGIQIINDISSNYILHVDNIRFKQVILNFMSNAIKYNNDKGAVTLNCNVIDENQLRINVIDTGNGLTENEQSLLFKPFERLGKYKGIDGAGIGLVISKNLIELMNGSIGVESEIGKGSRFWIQVPLS